MFTVVLFDAVTSLHANIRVQKLPEEIGFFPEEWKKLEKRYFFHFLPEEKNWKKVEEIGRNTCSQMCLCTLGVGNKFPDTVK